MAEWWKRYREPQQLILLAVLLSTVLLNVQHVMSGTGWNRDRDQRLQESSVHVEQLTRTVAELSDAVERLQSANEQLVQTAMRGTPTSPSVDMRLRAIETQVAESNMLFRRYLEQYRRP